MTLKWVMRKKLPAYLASMAPFLAGGCGDAWNPDAPGQGVTCVGETCFLTQTDAFSAKFFLCDQASCDPALGDPALGDRLLARGALLTGNGDQVVLVGPLVSQRNIKLGTHFVGVAQVAALEGPKPTTFVPLRGVPGDLADMLALQLQGAASIVAPDGNVVAFLGLGRTERVVRLSDAVLISQPMPGLSPGPGADNARALRLADGGTLVVRQTNGTLERIEPGEMEAHQLWPNDSQPPYVAADLLQGSPGRLRAFESAGRIVLLGEMGTPVPFSETGERVLALEPAGPPRGADSRGAAVVPLPRWQADRGYPPGSVLVAGGGPEDAAGGAALDVYQPGLNNWMNVAPAPWSLHYSVPVLLPTGVIAFIGGRKDEMRVVYVDAKNHFAITQGSAPMARTCGAGTSALLLPSGAVFVTGGYFTADYKSDENDRAQPEVQILQPPYMFSGRPRPVIAAPPPAEIRAGEPFPLRVAPAPSDAAEVVLMAFGATVAGQNVAQRLVELSIDGRSQDGQGLTVMGPASLEVAPPGRYLLFVVDVVDGARVPSEGVAVSVPLLPPKQGPP
jgi:Domain of unknown function (DUF1929)